MTRLEEIENAGLSLPVEQRVILIQSLVKSLPSPIPDLSEEEEIAEAQRRDEEIQNGQVKPLTEIEFWDRVEAGRKR